MNETSTTGVTADPPLPPNWNEHLQDTVFSLAPYKLFPIAADTLEYATIAELLNPIPITSAEQIVNPGLWSRFVNTRKDMLLYKSDDLALLSKLSLNEKQSLQRMHISLGFDKHAQVAACPYDDNVALLFHCTRDAKNVDTILLQGLDERVGSGGTMGKGIYFAADPNKSIMYDGCAGTIFIFMVILGDCLSLNQQNMKNFVREPEKQQVQQRNLTDIHFDSIVGQPNVASEYVVFNRYQCCPLYKIRYSRVASTPVVKNIYSESKNCYPPFSWTSLTPQSIPMPVPSTNSDWPFYAKTIFSRMGVEENQDVDVDMTSEVEIVESAESIEAKLTDLTNLGFMDAEMNLKSLKTNSYDLDKTVNSLLQLGAMIEQPTESEILINNKLSALADWGFTNAEVNLETLKKNSYDLGRTMDQLFQLGAGISQPSGSSVCSIHNTDLPDVEMIETAESIGNKLTVLTSLGFVNADMNSEILKKHSFNLDRTINNLLELGGAVIDESEILINNKLTTMSCLGFSNAALNAEILKKHSYDLDKSISHLLELGSQSEPRNSVKRLDEAGSEPITYSKDSLELSKPEDCLICCNEYEVKATNWMVLQCSHKMCSQCYKQIEITRTTMKGVTQTFIKCPFCMKPSGVEIGTCPNGTMTASLVSTPCEGHEKFNSICIQYHIEDPVYQLRRNAYLPNNDEGKELLKLLRIAWDRRICFTIGTSATTGQQNVLVWNIHHKTALNGGVDSHGFPDDTYTKRCKLELKAYGIE